MGTNAQDLYKTQYRGRSSRVACGGTYRCLGARQIGVWSEAKAHADFSHMSYVVPVHATKQQLLGATTHCDGTARVQTVNKQVNHRFWHLIDEFRDLTGIPVVLNTSLNNYAEPIVESVDDAITFLLTTKADYLVIGSILISRGNEANLEQGILELCPALASHVNAVLLEAEKCENRRPVLQSTKSLSETRNQAPLSLETLELLRSADGKTTLECLLQKGQCGNHNVDSLVAEVIKLWSQRLIVLRPRGL
jgi:carbamoyltransferase